VLTGGLAFDNGGFDATSWGWATLLPLVVVGVALVLGAAAAVAFVPVARNPIGLLIYLVLAISTASARLR
jgi:hypothetical protein